MGAIPGICFRQSCLEIGFLGAGGRLSLVVGNSHTPIISSLWSGVEPPGLHIHALGGTYCARLPYDIAETGIAGNLYAVGSLQHSALTALEHPGEVNVTLIDTDGVAHVLCTKVCDVECKD